jgi:hypothetical protein
MSRFLISLSAAKKTKSGGEKKFPSAGNKINNAGEGRGKREMRQGVIPGTGLKPGTLRRPANHQNKSVCEYRQDSGVVTPYHSIFVRFGLTEYAHSWVLSLSSLNIPQQDDERGDVLETSINSTCPESSSPSAGPASRITSLSPVLKELFGNSCNAMLRQCLKYAKVRTRDSSPTVIRT